MVNCQWAIKYLLVFTIHPDSYREPLAISNSENAILQIGILFT
jgi:hypothetical protein